MKKQAYIQPITECVVAHAERIMLTISDNNGDPNNLSWQETIPGGGETDNGDFAKYDTGWGNLWED